MSVFELATLIPEPLTFVDTDGTRYDARPVSAFGAIDYARYERMQREATAALGALAARDTTTDKEAAARQLEQTTNDLILTIVPSLPMERIEQIAFAHKSQFLRWWQNEQPKPEVRAGEAKAGRPVTRGRRSPASAGSTRPSRPKAS
jgi:hypothetical protein